MNTLSSSLSMTDLEHVLNYAARFQKQYGYIIVVLDHMSDQHNHIANITTKLLPLLKKTVRPTDTIFRYTPDSWIVCLDDCDERFLQWTQHSLQTLLNRRSSQIASPLDGALTFVKGSFLNLKGLAQTLRAFEHEVQLAKSALHRLKTMRTTALGNIEALPEYQNDLISVIHQAILDNRLFLAFQPIVDTHTKKLHYYECLARILDKNGQILPAAQFISRCEKAGLIQLIDQKIQDLVIQELMNDRTLKLALNVSAITASDPAWLNSLKAHMTARPDLRGRIIVELTETSVFYDVEESIRFMTDLSDLGCQVSIDDFGAGYMSLMHLKSDLVKVVKIDAQFVKGLNSNSTNKNFIRAILALTQPLGIKCVAEGVEDIQTAAILAEENVDYLQGYYISKPSDIRAWM